MLVDWKHVATLPPTDDGDWSGPVIFTTSTLSAPFPTWGLRDVTLGS